MKGFTKDGKFHPIKSYKKGTRKSRDQSAKTQGVRMKRYNVCDPFLEDPASHRPDDTKHTNQVMYSLGDESCASVLTDEEFSMLLTDDQVANTFNPIGETATKWQENEAFRKRIIDRSLELIEEQKKSSIRNKHDDIEYSEKYLNEYFDYSKGGNPDTTASREGAVKFIMSKGVDEKTARQYVHDSFNAYDWIGQDEVTYIAGSDVPTQGDYN